MATLGNSIWGIESNIAYSLKDLISLCEKKQPTEYFAHMRDIPPTQRDNNWDECTRSLSSNYLLKISLKKKITREDFLRSEFLNSFSVNQANSEFQDNRDTIGHRYIKECFSKKQGFCQEDLDSFWSYPPLREEVTLKFTPYFQNSWEVFKYVLNKPRAEIYCQKKIIQNSIFQQFNKIQEIDSDAYILKVDSITHPSCWKALIPAMKRELTKDKSPFSRNLKRVLLLKSQIRKAPENFTLFKPFFNNLKPGESLNKAWNFIESLKKNKKQRSDLEKWLDQTPIISFSLFENPNQFYRRTLMNHLMASFPEFFSNFTDRCLVEYAQDSNNGVRCVRIILDKSNNDYFSEPLRKKARLILPGL